MVKIANQEKEETTKKTAPATVLPAFIKAGSKGSELVSDNKSKFVKIEEGTTTLLLLTDLNPPSGEEETGSNCIISINQYSVFDSSKQRPEGVPLPIFPQLIGPSDPGALLGLKSKMRCFAIVQEEDADDGVESIFVFGKMVFDQLCELALAEGSLKGRKIRVTRRGSGMNTKYTVTLTSKQYEIDGEPETNLLDHIGPSSRDAIIDLLVKNEIWPPVGGDPFATPKKKSKPVVEEDDEEESEFEKTE